MKLKHNKKRNTAFLFETLVREMTRSIIREDKVTKELVLKILKEHFCFGSSLHKELELYRSLCETCGLNERSAQRLLQEVKEDYKKLNKKSIFTEQGAVIKQMNRGLSKDIFNTFVPNYKNLATVYQIFNGEASPAKRVLLEEMIVDSLVGKNAGNTKQKDGQVNNLVIKNFVNKFNKKYSGNLSENQSRLLQNYVLSFADNAVGLRVYLNEEIGRLREVLNSSLRLSEVSEDKDIVEKTHRVLNMLEHYKHNRLTKDSLSRILKIQDLAREIKA